MKHYEFGDTVKLTDGLSARIVADIGGEMILASVIISGWGDPMGYIRRDEIVEASPICAECQSIILDGEPVEHRDDGADLCRDCYRDLYAERDARDAWYVDGDRRHDQAQEDGRRW